MLRHLAKSIAVRQNKSIVNVASQVSRRGYALKFQDGLNENDKWTKDKMELPFEIPGRTLGVDFANELFRFAYNTDQMGFFNRAFEVMKEYIDVKGAPMSIEKNEVFFRDMYDLGIPDEVAHDLVPHLFSIGQGDELKVVVETYINYYYAHNKFFPRGVLSFGVKKAPAKYNLYLNRNLISSVCSTTSFNPRRVAFKQEVDYALLGGYNILLDGIIEVHSTVENVLRMPKIITTAFGDPMDAVISGEDK